MIGNFGLEGFENWWTYYLYAWIAMDIIGLCAALAAGKPGWAVAMLGSLIYAFGYYMVDKGWG